MKMILIHVFTFFRSTSFQGKLLKHNLDAEVVDALKDLRRQLSENDSCQLFGSGLLLLFSAEYCIIKMLILVYTQIGDIHVGYTCLINHRKHSSDGSGEIGNYLPLPNVLFIATSACLDLTIHAFWVYLCQIIFTVVIILCTVLYIYILKKSNGQ